MKKKGPTIRQLRARIIELEGVNLRITSRLELAEQSLLGANQNLASTRRELETLKGENLKRDACHKQLHEEVDQMARESKVERRAMATAYSDALRTVLTTNRHNNGNQPDDDAAPHGILEKLMGLREALANARGR